MRPGPLGHVPALDGVRGLAVVSVVAYHVMCLLVPTPATIEPDVVPGGFLGVDLFFVLSGFLITTLLLDRRAAKGRWDWWRFYRGRALRLLPALVVLLSAHGLYAAISGLDRRTEAITALAALGYVVNWLVVSGATVADGLGHLWSLSVEEQFYLGWPMTLAGLGRVGRRRWFTPLVVAAVVVLVAVHRARLHGAGVWFVDLYVRTDTRLDAPMVGALVALGWRRGWVPPPAVVRAGAWLGAGWLVVSIARFPVSAAVLPLGGYTAVALAAGAVTLAAVDSSWSGRRVLAWAPLRVLGRVSYGLYLWHLAVFTVVARYGAAWAPAMRIGLGLVLAGAATAASWRWVERPALAWKARLERRPA